MYRTQALLMVGLPSFPGGINLVLLRVGHSYSPSLYNLIQYLLRIHTWSSFQQNPCISLAFQSRIYIVYLVCWIGLGRQIRTDRRWKPNQSDCIS